MLRIETVCCSVRPRTVHGTEAGACLRALAALLVALWLAAFAAPHAQAATVELVSFELTRDEDSARLSFAMRFELPLAVEEALHKGVPLYFVAEADLYRSRWYWRDVRVARATRIWRLAWQPLARSYRVSFGGLHQTFESLPDALSALRGAVRWKLADASQLEEGAQHYVEFSYRLDTGQLPRPMQIGLAGQSDWALAVEHTEPLK